MIPLQQPSPSRKQQMTRSSGNYRYLNRHQCSRGGEGERERLVSNINDPRLLLIQPFIHIISEHWNECSRDWMDGNLLC